MDNAETFIMLDEFGVEQEARILNVVEINNQEYLVYAVSKNEEEESIFTDKLIRDQNGEENIVSIEDEEEKKMVFETIKEVIEDLD